MLKGRRVELASAHKCARIYSADLSAATDYIGHELAQTVGRVLNRRLASDQRECAAVMKILGSHDDEGVLTSSGIHMGLGPTWVVLSLLNSFAAWNAGARKESYAVCGDDLVGLWKPSIKRKYEATLERLGLVVNKSKSFYGDRGVFCERLIERVSPTEAFSRDVGHLSALTAAKSRSGRSNAHLATADNPELLESSLTDIGRRTMRQFVPRHTGPGKIRHFGCGEGSLELGGLFSLVRGQTTLVQKSALFPKQLKATLATISSSEQHPSLLGGSVTISEFAIAYKTAVFQRQLRDGSMPKSPMPISNAEFKKQARSNRPPRKGRESAVCDKLALEVQASSLPRKHRSTARQIIIGLKKQYERGLPTTNSRRRLENILSRQRREVYIEHGKAAALIREYTGVEEDLLQQQAHVRRLDPALRDTMT